MKAAYAGEVAGKIQQVIIEQASEAGWQEKLLDSIQNSVGDHGVTGLVVVALAGAGVFAYNKFKKK